MCPSNWDLMISEIFGVRGAGEQQVISHFPLQTFSNAPSVNNPGELFCKIRINPSRDGDANCLRDKATVIWMPAVSMQM